MLHLNAEYIYRTQLYTVIELNQTVPISLHQIFGLQQEEELQRTTTTMTTTTSKSIKENEIKQQ